MQTLADLKLGETATIHSCSDKVLSIKLMEMGCIPGEEIRMELAAPLGDPCIYSVSGYFLSMRRSEAYHVLISFS